VTFLIKNFDVENPTICDQSVLQLLDNCPPLLEKKFLICMREGGVGIIKHTKNTFFGQKFQNSFFQIFPEIFILFFFLICFFTAEFSHFLGQKI
jgi:hypothetical protein